MKKSRTRTAAVILFAYALAACLAAAGAHIGGVVFRQYLRIANEVILTSGLIAVLLIWNSEIPCCFDRSHPAQHTSSGIPGD